MPLFSAQEHAVVLKDWPQPEVVAEAQIHADEHALLVRYNTAGNKVAVIRLPLCYYSVFGAPNDEAIGGHPLRNKGLELYSVHEVTNSSLVQMLEPRNSVHPRHDRRAFLANKKHYIFTFQDSTLECVAIESEGFKPTVSIVATEQELQRAWRTGVAQ